MATIGFSKVFILDKYFTELQKFWETEKKLQGMQVQDASSSNEAAHLQQRLKNLSSELVTLRNRIHVNGQPPGGGGPQVPPHAPHPLPLTPNNNPNAHNNNNNVNNNYQNQGFSVSSPLRHHQLLSSQNPMGYPNKPLPPHPQQNSNERTPSNNGHLNNNLHNLNNISSIVHHGTNNGNTESNSDGFYVNQPQFPKDAMRSGNGPTIQNGCSGVSENGKLGGSAGSVNGTTATTTSGGDATTTTPSESSYKLSTKSAPTTLGTTGPRRVRLADLEDLIHLSGPLTEDALIRCLQARCAAGKHYAYMGPILLMANPLNAVGNALTLTSTKGMVTPTPVQKVVQEALRQQCDTGYPQAIILSGCSGSGKTLTSMLVLRHLFELAGGGLETDAFKHLSASISVLRSLGTARTALNTESSRIGHFIEVQVTEKTVYRTKVHCYFLDQSRVIRTAPEEKNYHIFYQMLAGLTPEERTKLHLSDHRIETLRYLKSSDCRTDETEDALRFLEWKQALGVLGIPFLDVVRVLAAVILIGNVNFLDSQSCMDVDVEGESELQAAASLLGVSETALKQGLTTRTRNVRNQLVRSQCDANLSNVTRDALAKSLYCRTVATIVRRANSLKRLGSTSGTLSSDSTDSVNNQMEVASQHASTVGTAGSKASKSMTALNNAVRHATDGFIGILDMFGFEDVKPSHLEHLCINLCAETMQHFYNTHIFKACIESCRDEGIQCEWEVDYVDNVPCIDLISSLRTGLLSMLDVECSVRGTVENYISKVRAQHKQNPRLVATKTADFRSFAIQHYAGKVTYDATRFLDTNRDTLADNLVAVFHKHRCSFGFASHLFSSELKVLGAGGIEPSARGISFRISPTSHSELLNGDEPVTTLTQDFHTRLDNLLRTLVHARPHFVRCLKINQAEAQGLFDRHTVSKQMRAFQVLETVNLMVNGYPHRMRFKAFNTRYKLLAPFNQLSRCEDKAIEDCQLILDCFDNTIDSRARQKLGHVSISWALGKRHIFLSEGARQQLENLRTSTRNRAGTLIQAVWRGFSCRKRFPSLRQRSHSKRLPLPLPLSPTASSGQSNARPPNLPPPNGSLSNVPFMCQNVPMTNGTWRNLPHNMQCSMSPPPPPPHAKPVATVVPGGLSPTVGSNVAAAQSSNNSTWAGAAGPASSNASSQGGRPRPQPISGTPPPDAMERCDPKLVQQTCSLFGLDMERPPPLPPSRSYTVKGNTKLNYPQTRVMKMTFPEEGTASEVRLLKGHSVLVVGASPRRGHLIVEHKNQNIHVPFQYLELKPE